MGGDSFKSRLFTFLLVWRNVVLYLSSDHPPLQTFFKYFLGAGAWDREGGGGVSEASAYCSICSFLYFCKPETESKQTRS